MVNNKSYHYIEVAEFGGPEVLKLRVEELLELGLQIPLFVRVSTTLLRINHRLLLVMIGLALLMLWVRGLMILS
jgi:hypothetical protein